MKSKIVIFVILFVILNSTFFILNCFTQWESDVQLTNATGNSVTSGNNAWCIATNGNVVHTIWYDERDGNAEIYYKRSTNGGLNWGADIRLTNNTATSGLPSIAVSGDIVHVVWADNRDGNWQIYYKRSTDGGINWGADIRLTNNIYTSSSPSIAVSGTLVHIVWDDNRDGSNPEIYYKRSTDSGLTFGTDIRLTNNTYSSYSSSIAVSGTFLNIVWEDLRDGNREIYYKRSTDGGISWGSDTRLTNHDALSNKPSVAVSGALVHVVWYDYRLSNNQPGIYYKFSSNSGLNWSADIRLVNDTAFSYSPSIAVSGSVVNVVWRDARELKSEIYYKRSTDGGINWGTEICLTNKTFDSLNPFIAVSGSSLHILWYYDSYGNKEIYYKRNPTGIIQGIQNISNEIPSAFSLEQNYPNPFNPITKIQFNVPSCHSGGGWNPLIIIKVFDILGKEVSTLVNENLQPGTYEIAFDGSALSSGVYFYKLITDGFAETKRMVLLK